MTKPVAFTYYLSLATERGTLARAIRVALLVGLILNLINTPGMFFNMALNDVSVGRILLTFLVPYCVSTYSSVLSNSNLQPGKVSHLDAILKCKSCRKSNFHVHIGQVVEECAECKKKTRWKPLKIFSKIHADNEVIKSLALFARYNPQPLFRTDENCIILGANPASEKLVGNENLSGTNLTGYIPQISKINFRELIEKEKVEEEIVNFNGKFYNMVFRGVPVLNSVQVYANNITEIILAEAKIKKQANEIQESINYAWRIQQAMLPDSDLIKDIFKGHFIFYRPKNTVSGDFYWVNQVGNKKIIAVGDCTGHGVPGAFMSVLGISLLNEIILRENILQPGEILNILRERLINSLKSVCRENSIADGIDISLAVIDDKNNISFAGAYNPLYLFRKEKLTIMEADRMPVGEYVNGNVSFSQKTFKLTRGDKLVMFTDGYKDQYGGERNKKLTTRKFKELLINNSRKSMDEQLNDITKHFDGWKNTHEQIDDVLVMGIEI